MPDNLFSGLAFYIVSAFIVVFALMVVLLPRIVHAALSLVLFFVAIAGIYILLGAEFVAIAQVIIYAGAITVLVLFAIMLTQGSQLSTANTFNSQALIAGVVAIAAFAALLPALLAARPAQGPPPSANLVACFGGQVPASVTVFQDVPGCLGRLMLTDYVIAFEVASVLLLVAMIGAIVIARES